MHTQIHTCTRTHRLICIDVNNQAFTVRSLIGGRVRVRVRVRGRGRIDSGVREG